MLSLPKELAVLCHSRLSLVIAVAAGHDPIEATGLVLAHISGICSQTRLGRLAYRAVLGHRAILTIPC